MPLPAASRAADPGPTITAMLADGPLEGQTMEAEVVEGRPPKIIEARGPDGIAFRYCLADWVQAGQSAACTILYRVE